VVIFMVSSSKRSCIKCCPLCDKTL
jgi:hypothetical protein